jgi:hypothetical protein
MAFNETEEKVNPVKANATPTQQQGGMGNPYVGTGWNNLGNFLNQGNLNWGTAKVNAPNSMDMSQGRSGQAAGFDNWVYGAGHTNGTNKTQWTGNVAKPGPVASEDYSGIGPPVPQIGSQDWVSGLDAEKRQKWDWSRNTLSGQQWQNLQGYLNGTPKGW